MGIVVLAVGLIGTLGSVRLAKWSATHMRLSRGSPKPSPDQVETIRRVLLGWILLTGLVVTAVGVMWIAGIGNN
jgi:hypothetical protein